VNRGCFSPGGGTQNHFYIYINVFLIQNNQFLIYKDNILSIYSNMKLNSKKEVNTYFSINKHRRQRARRRLRKKKKILRRMLLEESRKN
jgi:hypothetical protein